MYYILKIIQGLTKYTIIEIKLIKDVVTLLSEDFVRKSHAVFGLNI